MMDVDKGDAAVENSIEEKAEVLEVNTIIEPHAGLEGNAILEPCVGMKYESEDSALKYYTEYARQLGFVVRIMQRRPSGIDGRTLARQLGCNKQGFSPNHKGLIDPEKKPRSSAREGCKATILVKMEKSGKWVVTRFVRDHNHPLVVTSNGFSTEGDKDKKIEELTRELEHQEQRCAIYRERLFSFMNNIEEHSEELSSKIQVIVDNVRKVESQVQKFSHHR
ncbi:protein FAR1-RELATED SEQUENCE 5 [Tripterygium wilfordii]|uniref:Protein FAR1-RELATED SEQUENCE 5 n=1 Tax=Tripterygium wilfordii TaxID=458696 RepID=A0A7J7D4Q2_TRIWF|nr:protein FAR-RED IMPAIRED RESPONSE 1-like [Tripterygium wilfordii]KAF5741324.1 protein FAR1-RELATED SEQUENCE 5 [Tripterygium wilfordii]